MENIREAVFKYDLIGWSFLSRLINNYIGIAFFYLWLALPISQVLFVLPNSIVFTYQRLLVSSTFIVSSFFLTKIFCPDVIYTHKTKQFYLNSLFSNSNQIDLSLEFSVLSGKFKHNKFLPHHIKKHLPIVDNHEDLDNTALHVYGSGLFEVLDRKYMLVRILSYVLLLTGSFIYLKPILLSIITCLMQE